MSNEIIALIITIILAALSFSAVSIGIIFSIYKSQKSYVDKSFELWGHFSKETKETKETTEKDNQAFKSWIVKDNQAFKVNMMTEISSVKAKIDNIVKILSKLEK